MVQPLEKRQDFWNQLFSRSAVQSVGADPDLRLDLSRYPGVTVEDLNVKEFEDEIRREEKDRIGPFGFYELHPYDTTDHDPYAYSVLQRSNEIRLLKLLPGSPTEPLRCELEHRAIGRLQDYEAISYAWGSKLAKLPILCHDKVLYIPRNLAYALWELRFASKTRVLWADAICINQTDGLEKSEQVKLMGSIFKMASKVLVWLGVDTSDQAQRAAAVVSRIYHSRFTTTPPLDDRAWSALEWLYQNTWFERLWCLQEIVLAKRAEVIWGSVRIPWEYVGFVPAWLHTFSDRDPDGILLDVPYHNALLMASLTSEYVERNQLSFLDLIALSRQFKVTDARDRVYGLLGIPITKSGQQGLFMEPDYSKTKYEVYVELARNIVDTSDSLRILSYVQHGREIDDSIPSWVPQWDWFCRRGLVPAGIRTPSFSASRGISSYKAKVEGTRLSARGFSFDTISEVIPFGIDENFRLYDWYVLLDRLWTDAILPRGAYPDGSDAVTVLCWTMTAGKDWYGMLVQDRESHLADFAECVHYCYHPWIRRNQGRNALRRYLSMPSITPVLPPGHHFRFLKAVGNACSGRCLFVTGKGYIGIGPDLMKEGDQVSILNGAIVPLVLRRTGDSCKLVGEAYVHGIMFGEACEKAGGKNAELEMVCLD